jgi:hypothetical protein
MVTSYGLAGSKVIWDGLPYPSTFMTGRDACRHFLLNGAAAKFFGGPSASLIRASVLWQKRPFYNPLNYHGDTEAYLDLLRDHDFGFVHQVLTYKRRGEASRTTHYLARVNSYLAEDVDEITKFGPVYLTKDENDRLRRELWWRYYRFLGAAVVDLRGKEFWHYHLVHFRAMGYRLSYARIAWNALLRILDMIGNPKRTIQGGFRLLFGMLTQRSSGAQRD